MRPIYLPLLATAATAALVACAPLPAAAQASPAPAPAPAGNDLAWLAGCWEQRTPRRVVQEMWFPPAGGVLLGMSRTLRRGAATDGSGDTIAEFEFLRIHTRDGALVYAAQPSGRPPTEFRAHAASDTSVTFTNLQNDFPQHIRYRRVGADSLLARIEGTMNGQSRAIDFPYARAVCPGSR